MKRLAVIFATAAALSAATPLTATAAAPSGGVCTVTGIWPLTALNIPYCE